MSWRDDFKELPPGYKLSLCASWFCACTLCLFVGSSLVVVGNWAFGKDVPQNVLKAFVLGLGASAGGLMFACGATMKGDFDAQSQLERLLHQRQKVEHHHCRSCKYYSTNIDLHCAVNPEVVLTESAINCTDWEEVG